MNLFVLGHVGQGEGLDASRANISGGKVPGLDKFAEPRTHLVVVVGVEVHAITPNRFGSSTLSTLGLRLASVSAASP
jgi:hypothetical protein